MFMVADGAPLNPVELCVPLSQLRLLKSHCQITLPQQGGVIPHTEVKGMPALSGCECLVPTLLQ